MLNLQTITEQLGTICEGRAWVVVTSQEDLDAVLRDPKTFKKHDFSKIQGRFKTRLSLSSRNVDEVIKRRLLEKADRAKEPLQKAFKGKQDILANHLSLPNLFVRRWQKRTKRKLAQGLFSGDSFFPMPTGQAIGLANG
jgi:hypothetical protein